MSETIITKKGKYSIRPYQSEDEQGVLNLWEAAFYKKLANDIWKWKYLENPYGKQIMLCVSEDNTPVAMYSGIPYEANWQGHKVRFTHPMDNMSHPDHRDALSGRKGLFVKTAEHFFDRYGGMEDSVFMYGFPGKRHFKLGQLVMHYKALPEGPAFFCFPTNSKKFKTKKFLATIDLVKDLDIKIDQLWQSLKVYYPFAINRDSIFLEWRFMRNPNSIYEIYILKSFFGPKLLGYAVLGVQDDKAKLVDILVPDEPRVLEDFFARLNKSLSDRNINWLEFWVPGGHFIDNFLKSKGEQTSAEPIGFIPVGRSFDARLSIDWALRNLFYTMADGDIL